MTAEREKNRHRLPPGGVELALDGASVAASAGRAGGDDEASAVALDHPAQGRGASHLGLDAALRAHGHGRDRNRLVAPAPPYTFGRMPTRRPRYRTGRPELDRLIGEVLDEAGVTKDRDLLFEILVSSVLLAGDAADTLDLKITSATLREMREAFRLFAAYRGQSKVTIFGSARVRPDSKEYEQARAIAAEMAANGWMVVTGAGPGIMAAGMEGAGRERSIGVSIRLPFEQGANPIIAHDEKLVSMKYFFTRKLMLIKESAAFICLPGGFGTLDETFELLTLTQTGKGEPVPIVLLDVPGGTYWESAKSFIENELVTRGLVDPTDLALFCVTDSVERAVREITGFYANYESMRYVGDVLVLRLHTAPSDAQLEDLNARFGHLCASGRIERTTPLADEVADDDKLDLPRVRLNFAKRYYGQLRSLIDALNALAPSPPRS
jgi:uncharacterized protein (TIGR00730 family)